MEAIQTICHDVQLACALLWQDQLHASEHMVNASTKFAESLQMAEDVNQMQQDMVTLDVGGHVHHLSRQSATRHRDSFFGALFSNTFNPGKCTDSEFIDRDGKTFNTIAFYLRYGKWACSPCHIKHVKRECVFYCLPSPPTSLPYFVWTSRNSTPWMIHFTTEDGTTHESIPGPSECDNLTKFAVSSTTSLYIANEAQLFEYDYFSTQWKCYSIDTHLHYKNIRATNNALYAMDWSGDIYKMQLDGTWRWASITQHITFGSFLALSISHSMLTVVQDWAVVVYDDHTQLWSGICKALPHEYCQWCIVIKSWVYACVKGQILRRGVGLNSADWETTSSTFHSRFRVTYVCELHNALYVSTPAEYVRYDIAADGSLADSVNIDMCGQKFRICLGIRDDWMGCKF